MIELILIILFLQLTRFWPVCQWHFDKVEKWEQNKIKDAFPFYVFFRSDYIQNWRWISRFRLHHWEVFPSLSISVFLGGYYLFSYLWCLYFIPQRVSAFSLSLPCTAILFALVVYLTSFLLTLDLVYEFWWKISGITLVQTWKM